MDQITVNDLVNLLQDMAQKMIAAKEDLNALDRAIGDGDLGVSMTLGFQALQQQLSSGHYEDMQTVLSDCETAFADHAASTFGALMATMFNRASRVVKGKSAIGPEDVAGILKAAAEGVQKRGNANLGDKTILDALVPASAALEKTSLAGKSLPSCMDAALEAARTGAEQTIQMRSKAGRAGWLGDRTVGAKDPGAAAFVMMLDAATNFIKHSG